RSAEKLDPAARRGEEADCEMEQRRLAGSVRSHERGHPARGELERAVPQRPLVAVALAEPGGLEDRAHAALSSVESRSVDATNATMLSSSSPAACASRSQRTSPPRSRVYVPGGGPARVPTTNVPWPGRPATSPSRSSSRYAFSTV